MSSSGSSSFRFFPLDELLVEYLYELLASSLRPASTILERRRSTFGVNRIFLVTNFGINSVSLSPSSSDDFDKRFDVETTGLSVFVVSGLRSAIVVCCCFFFGLFCYHGLILLHRMM